MPEQQREDLLDGVAVGEQPLERSDRGRRVVANDGLRELEDVRLDRAGDQAAHVVGGHHRAAGVGAELLHLLLDALGVGAHRRGQHRHGLGSDLDTVQPSARFDPTRNLSRRQALDPLDRSPGRRYGVDQRHRR